MAARTPSVEAMAIGRKLREARDKKVMSQTDMVNECRKHPETAKLAVETISRAERGLHVPRRRALRVFAQVLDIPLDELRLGGEQDGQAASGEAGAQTDASAARAAA